MMPDQSGRVQSPWITTDEPCPSGDTDCTVDCGACKGTGKRVTGRVLTPCNGSTFDCVVNGHYEDRCPGCGGEVGGESCHFTYTTWRCFGCGAHLDSRVVVPKQVHKEMSQ